jgi:ubiquinone/menaquinone biosynthesis C-methylase UbiE
MCADYVLDSANECERLERQAVLDGLERHLRHLPKRSRVRVLDAGCGSGAMARLMASSHPDWDVVGVDFNSNYVAYARGRGRAASLANLSFEQGDLRALNFANASFDVIWSRFVLYFLPSPDDALREFRRVLHAGGEVVVALHNFPNMIDHPEDADLRNRRTRAFSSILDGYLPQKLPSILSKCGFRDVSVEIELDRIYSAIGPIGAEGRRNYAEVLQAGMEPISQSLGSQAEAERLIADLSVYLDRPDTYTYNLLWTIKCGAPSAVS